MDPGGIVYHTQVIYGQEKDCTKKKSLRIELFQICQIFIILSMCFFIGSFKETS